MAALDTAVRQTWTVPSLLEPVGIQVPTLVVDGEYETIARNVPRSESGWLDDEASFYPPEPAPRSRSFPTPAML